tara:strand:+ start:63 stop:518 length:456 start_codon:yes stop_codon:yes gene_type:complete
MTWDINRYNAANVNQLFERISKNSIGMDEYFDRLFKLHETTTNYPPYNLVAVTEDEFKLEIALAGFAETDVKVYTERGKLTVEGSKANQTADDAYVHRGLAQRSFTRAWTIADDTEVKSVEFVNGLLTVTLGRIVPEKHQKKLWFGTEDNS